MTRGLIAPMQARSHHKALFRDHIHFQEFLANRTSWFWQVPAEADPSDPVLLRGDDRRRRLLQVRRSLPVFGCSRHVFRLALIPEQLFRHGIVLIEPSGLLQIQRGRLHHRLHLPRLRHPGLRLPA